MNWRLKYWLAGLLLSLSNAALAFSRACEVKARKVLGRAPLPLFKDNLTDRPGR